MAGMINNFYYGKAGQADYTPEQMPTTRVALFFEMLRIRFTGLFGMNFMYLLFSLPAVVWTLMTLAVMLSVQPDAAPVDSNPMYMYLTLLIPCLGISGIGAPGLMYVLRNWARDQHSFAFSDFKEQVKSNWKQGLVVGLINGFMLLVAYIGYIFYGQESARNVIFVAPQMFTVILCVFWWMMNMVIYPMMVTYDMKLMQLIRNSAIVVLARLPWAALVFVLSLLPAALVFIFISNQYVPLIVGLFYLVLGFALTGFGYASFANATFDRLINPNIAGAPVNMGMRDPSLDDDDDEETPEQQA